MSRFHVVFGCRPDQGRGTCRNSANASIVSQRLHYQRRFYLRPKFRQMQRLLGPAYPKSETPKLAHLSIETLLCPGLSAYPCRQLVRRRLRFWLPRVNHG